MYFFSTSFQLSMLICIQNLTKIAEYHVLRILHYFLFASRLVKNLGNIAYSKESSKPSGYSMHALPQPFQKANKMAMVQDGGNTVQQSRLTGLIIPPTHFDRRLDKNSVPEVQPLVFTAVDTQQKAPADVGPGQGTLLQKGPESAQQCALGN